MDRSKGTYRPPLTLGTYPISVLVVPYVSHDRINSTVSLSEILLRVPFGLGHGSCVYTDTFVKLEQMA
jgi:hypothetical protein